MKGLKSIRQKLGISQAELEKMTGIDANTFSRYERGVVVPSVEVAQKVAEALKVSVDELLNGPVKQEFEVKIMMGVKSVTGLTGVEVTDNSMLYGIQDDKPQIHLAGKVMIGTPEEREKALATIIENFKAACWMFDHKAEAKARA